MDTGTSMAHKRLRRGYWGLTGRWCCQRLGDVLVAFIADKGLAERFLLLKSTLFQGDSRGWVFVCCLSLWEMGSLVSSHSHTHTQIQEREVRAREWGREVHAHTSSKSSTSPSLSSCSLFASAYCIIALTLDFCQSLSIRKKWQIHMFWQTAGEEIGGFSFWMLRNFKSDWQLDASVPFLKSWYGVCRGMSYLSGCSCRCLSCRFVILQGALVSPGSSDLVTQRWSVCDSTIKVAEGHVRNSFWK